MHCSSHKKVSSVFFFFKGIIPKKFYSVALEEVVAEELELFMWLIKSKLMPSFFALVRDRVSSFFHKSSRSRSRFLSLQKKISLKINFHIAKSEATSNLAAFYFCFDLPKLG